jgi:hypothetical protein
MPFSPENDSRNLLETRANSRWSSSESIKLEA